MVKGTCALLRRGDEEELALVANLHQGASWGELEVFCGREWPEDHVIQAQQHRDVYHLVGDKFREIYEEFTVEHEALRRVLRGRTQDYITSEECVEYTLAYCATNPQDAGCKEVLQQPGSTLHVVISSHPTVTQISAGTR